MNTTQKTKTKSRKFTQIVDTATFLFMRFGVKRVTVEEICETAKVSKMTFYKYFKNKIDLAEYIIFSILELGQIELDKILEQDSPFVEKMNQFLIFNMQYAKQFSKEFLSDFIKLSPRIQQIMNEYYEKNQLVFIKIIETARQSGEIQENVSIKFVDFIIKKFIELREDDNLLKLFSNTEEITSDMINFLFYGIIGKK